MTPPRLLACLAIALSGACAAHVRYRPGDQLSDVACGAGACVASGYEMLLRSDDAGHSWHEVDSPLAARLGHLALAGPRILAAGERGALVASDDGGRSFHAEDSGLASSVVALTAVDAGHVLLVAQDGEVSASTDGGRTFDPQPGLSARTPHPAAVRDADWLDAQRGVLAADDLYFTSDGGRTFTRGESRALFPALTPPSTAGYVDWKSAGCTKAPTYQPPAPVPTAVRYFDGGKLAVALQDGRLFVSDDSGRSFGLVQKLDSPIVRLAVIDRRLWAVENDGSLARLDGARLRSTAQPALVAGPMQAVAGAGGAALAAAGRGLATSDDGGATWDKRDLSLGGLFARALYNRDPDWDHFFVPGGGAIFYQPLDASLGGTLAGWEGRIAVASWSHNNNNPGPSQVQLTFLADVFPQATGGALAFYGGGTTLSFERNAPRRFFIPTFGLDLGALHQDAFGTVFALRPHLGLTLVNVRRLQLEAVGGYQITTARLDELRGPYGGADLLFTLW